MGRYGSKGVRCKGTYADGRSCDDRAVYAVVAGNVVQGNVPTWSGSCRQHLAQVSDRAAEGTTHASVIPVKNLVGA